MFIVDEAMICEVDAKRIERDLANRLQEWRGLLKRQTPIARQVLLSLLAHKIAWTPRKDERLYEFAGRAKFDRILAGIVDTEGRESTYRYHTFGNSPIVAVTFTGAVRLVA